jgi:hypothetical protein
MDDNDGGIMCPLSVLSPMQIIEGDDVNARTPRAPDQHSLSRGTSYSRECWSSADLHYAQLLLWTIFPFESLL